MSSPILPTTRWDMFCKVVDNFGDIGVCWRLARQLADEYNIRMHLWVDDLALAQRFAGAGHAHIQLQHWVAGADFAQAAEVVIETFSCGLPEAYQLRMRSQRSLWVNVEYLSAERWVDSFHAQPSPQPNGLVRYFFYPGFTRQTGGLIRERNWSERQVAARQDVPAFWQALGLTPAPQSLHLSLFCYAHAPIHALLQSLRHAETNTRVLVPESVAPAVSAALGLPSLPPAGSMQLGHCEVCVIPFLSQADYDRLLHVCDVNFVRGEDSWIRALWAGKPMVWLPYQQEDGAHMHKLAAFLHCYTDGWPLPLSSLLADAMQAWAAGHWQATHTQKIISNLDAIKAHAQQTVMRLSQQPDVVTNLVIFIEKLRASRV